MGPNHVLSGLCFGVATLPLAGRQDVGYQALWVLAWGGAALLPAPTMAQGFPDKPIRLIVPWPPGGSDPEIEALAADFVGDAELLWHRDRDLHPGENLDHASASRRTGARVGARAGRRTPRREAGSGVTTSRRSSAASIAPTPSTCAARARP